MVLSTEQPESEPPVPPPSEVLIALSAGTGRTAASAFDPDGGELAHVRMAHGRMASTPEAPCYDPAEAWQAARLALRALADRVPDLARRAAALAVTGDGGGLVAIDEDGDPLEWRPDFLDQTARLLSAKDWIHFCLTGRAHTDPIGAVLALAATPGGRVHATDETLGLLPPVANGREEHRVGRAAAAAARLREGLPVILAPPAPVAAGLALGLLEGDPEVAFALLENEGDYLVPEVGPRRTDAGLAFELPFGCGSARLVAGTRAGEAFAWLLDLLQDVVGETGLIGTGREELCALLARRAAEAAPARLAFRQRAMPGQRPGGLLEGIARGTDLGDLARACLEEAGYAARDVFQRLAQSPREIRVAGDLAADPIVRLSVAARLQVPVRSSSRADATTAGAGLFAALTLGLGGPKADAGTRWVAPYLREPEPPDPALIQAYARAGNPAETCADGRSGNGATGFDLFARAASPAASGVHTN